MLFVCSLCLVELGTIYFIKFRRYGHVAILRGAANNELLLVNEAQYS
jgi:hypothetical protein